MSLLRNRFFSIILAIIISSAISALITVAKMKYDASVDSINTLFYDLSSELDILFHLSEHYPNDTYVRKKAERLVTGKLLALSAAKPNLNRMQGVPLDALYKAITSLKNYEWNSSESKEVFSIASQYIISIENDVVKLKTEKDEIFRKSLSKEILPSRVVTDPSEKK